MAAGLIVYLDTSAFLKLYLSEPESDTVRQLLSCATAQCTHLITYAEMRAGLARAVRMRRMTADILRNQIECFERDWETLRIIIPDDRLIRRAGALAEQFGLRGYDSVHLAAAEAVHDVVRDLEFRMVVYARLSPFEDLREGRATATLYRSFRPKRERSWAHCPPTYSRL